MNWKQWAAVGTAVCMSSAALLTGCTSSKDGGEAAVGDITFPLKETVTLTYWMPLDPTVSKNHSTMNDTELYKELEKRTGVKLEFQHPPLGQEQEQFNLMVASNELTDIFEYDMSLYQGGAQKALTDEIISPLNDRMEQYAPNLTAVLKQNPEWDKSVKTDDGTYYTFPFIRGDDRLRVYGGAMMRQDWLEELGLSMPETVEEWETVLTAFKEQKGATNPLSIELKKFKLYNIIAGAYGVANDMFLDDNGIVQFGPMMPTYKEYLATVKRWYDRGLLDRDFATNDGAAVTSKITTGKAGATVGTTGGNLGNYMNIMKSQDTQFNLMPAPYPTLNKGERPQFGQVDPSAGQNAFISPMCKQPEIAMKLLDYGYSEDGHMLFNFGVEGVSYNMQEGKPVYTEEITNHPQGWSFAESLTQYARSSNNGPFVQDYDYIEQYCSLPQQQAAISMWSDTDAKKHVMPSATPTVEESQRYAQIMADIDTYCEEMYLKFILGSESLDNFDTYVQHIKDMGIEEAVQIQRDAVERYNNR